MTEQADTAHDTASYKAIFTAAFDLAAEMPWRQVALDDIYRRAGLSDSGTTRPFRCKLSLLLGFASWVDEEVAAMAGEADDLAPRDRLFDLLMLRFDVLNPYRDGIAAIVKSLPSMPMTAFAGGPGLAKSMRTTLTQAGISTAGLAGMLRGKGLAFVYLTAVRAWLDDDSLDLSATMKALDQGLVKAEELALSVGLASSGSAEE